MLTLEIIFKTRGAAERVRYDETRVRMLGVALNTRITGVDSSVFLI